MLFMRSIVTFKNLLTTTSLVFLLSTACAQMTFDEKMNSLYSHTVPLIQSEEIKNKLTEKNLYILDIRSPKEYEVSHLAGARLVDYDSFDVSLVSDIPKDAEVIVYCSVGYRSEKVGEKLLKEGFTHVKNLYGGIFDWKNQGNVVINENNQPTDSVHTYNENWSQWLYNGIKVF